MISFSFSRLTAIILKEFVQMRRDRMTFGMMIGIPVMQLIIFGYAINSDPKNLPTAIHARDFGPFSRSMISAMHTSDYFNVVREVESEKEGDELLQRGEVQFLLTIPENFERELVLGKRPQLLLEADATDPMAVAHGISTVQELVNTVQTRELRGTLAKLQSGPMPIDLVIHRKYNPEVHTQYNIVPGLLGVILTMTMVFITALAITREKERGTMENLLSTPVRPVEVMIGKIIPYIFVGYVQIILILLGARFLFDVPMVGSLPLLFAVALFFIAANLSVGITFSTIAKNQLQAVQMSMFFFLPSILLSGFMFPFRGMPIWAQWVGSCLPLTHFLAIVRGILLKGAGLPQILPEFAALAAFLVIVMTIGILRYRQTLD